MDALLQPQKADLSANSAESASAVPNPVDDELANLMTNPLPPTSVASSIPPAMIFVNTVATATALAEVHEAYGQGQDARGGGRVHSQ